jgi:glycosyltransferase involved in cell wall biosynthesis
MHWVVIAPWMVDDSFDQWFLQYVDTKQHTFTIVPYQYAHSWHQRPSKTTPFSEWKKIWHHVAEAERRMGHHDGLITLFPQRAVIAGLRKLLFGMKYPVVCWYFNVGKIYGRWKSLLAQQAMQHVDKLVVPSTWELQQYQRWLKLPESRFAFAPYQSPLFSIEEKEEQKKPFVLALGSANRDYRLMFRAVEELNLPTIVVSSDKITSGLEIPRNVKVDNTLSRDECRILAQKARINVVPIGDTDTASGHVTIVEAMAMRRPLLVTECPGLSDYVENEVTALTYKAGDLDDLKKKLQRLWNDAPLRESLGSAGYQFVEAHCSDQAAAKKLSKILDEFSGKQPDPSRES